MRRVSAPLARDYPVSEAQIRTTLKESLVREYSNDRDTLILEELGLRHGAARVDLAVVNGLVHGFEIKSDNDTLDRLPRQVDIYNSVLDRITVAVGNRHLAKVVATVPRWWGIALATVSPNCGVSLSRIRTPGDNPCQSILAVAKLLWRKEALALLKELGAAGGLLSKPRKAIYARLVEVCPPVRIHARVCRQLRSRTDWRSGVLPMSSGG